MLLLVRSREQEAIPGRRGCGAYGHHYEVSRTLLDVPFVGLFLTLGPFVRYLQREASLENAFYQSA